ESVYCHQCFLVADSRRSSTIISDAERQERAQQNKYAKLLHPVPDATGVASIVQILQQAFIQLLELKHWLRSKDREAVQEAGQNCFLGYFLSLHSGELLQYENAVPRKAFLYALVSPFLVDDQTSSGIHFITRFQLWLDRLAYVFGVFSQKSLHQLEVLLRVSGADVTVSAKKFLQISPRAYEVLSRKKNYLQEDEK
ncbi:unnamed protein product, partial [Amoebophrya sp. A120]